MSKQPQGPTADNRILVELEVPAESALGREEAERVAPGRDRLRPRGGAARY